MSILIFNYSTKRLKLPRTPHKAWRGPGPVPRIASDLAPQSVHHRDHRQCHLQAGTSLTATSCTVRGTGTCTRTSPGSRTRSSISGRTRSSTATTGRTRQRPPRHLRLHLLHIPLHIRRQALVPCGRRPGLHLRRQLLAFRRDHEVEEGVGRYGGEDLVDERTGWRGKVGEVAGGKGGGHCVGVILGLAVSLDLYHFWGGGNVEEMDVQSLSQKSPGGIAIAGVCLGRRSSRHGSLSGSGRSSCQSQREEQKPGEIHFVFLFSILCIGTPEEDGK